MIASTGDDGLCKVWDVRVKDAIKTYESPRSYPLLSSAFAKDGSTVFCAGIDDKVYVTIRNLTFE